jgi:signal transduction histidine kinase
MEDDTSVSPPPSSKESAIASIESAKVELDEALEELNGLPTLDPNTIRYAAHAIKNYLTVNSMVVDLLSRELADHPNPDVGIWLESLRHTTTLMTQTVRLLTNASVAIKLDLKWEKVALPTLVRRVCNYYNIQAREKRIQVVFESSVKSPHVWTDRVATAVVLDNLLSNALKFSGPGKLVRVLITEEPLHLVCSVQDKGPGVSKDEQEKLFQKGVRLSPVPTGGELSIGYGLAISRDVIKKLGGEIWYEKQLPHGSCFSFRLPLYVEGKSELQKERPE